MEQEPELPPAESLLDSLRRRGDFEALDDDLYRWRTETRLVEYATRLGLDTSVDPAMSAACTV